MEVVLHMESGRHGERGVRGQPLVEQLRLYDVANRIVLFAQTESFCSRDAAVLPLVRRVKEGVHISYVHIICIVSGLIYWCRYLVYDTHRSA